MGFLSARFEMKCYAERTELQPGASETGPTMISLKAQITTLRSVMLALAAIQLATAASLTLVPLVLAEIGASQEAASLAAAAYSAGFLLGCFVVSQSIADFGHIRAFAAAAAIATGGAILFSTSGSVPVLLFLRFMIGLATASLFAIGDAWINETAAPSARGRVLSVYALVIGIVAVGSQAMVFVTPEDISEIFTVVSLIYCFAIIVITTTKKDPPKVGSKIVLRIKGVITDSPSAAAGAFASGIVTTTILSVMPFLAAELGMIATDVAIIVALIYVGRLIFQYPLGALSDRVDRRMVILIASCTVTVALLAAAFFSDQSYAGERLDFQTLEFFVLAVILIALGGSLLTIYSVLVAHALDRTVPVFVSSTAVTMLFIWTIGSIVGPLIASAATSIFGDAALNWLNFLVFLAFSAFVGLRIKQTEATTAAERARHVSAMTTSTELVPEQKR